MDINQWPIFPPEPNFMKQENGRFLNEAVNVNEKVSQALMNF